MYLAYKDQALPIDERVEHLLSLMTLPEKVGQMLQLDARPGLANLIEKFHVGSVLHTSPEELQSAELLVAKTRLQIPLLVADDAIHGHSFWEGATIYPTQLAMACSWNSRLVEKIARETAIEIAATGIHWTFSPVLCITRDLRWGRVGETFGEDPHLIGELGAAMIRGYQGQGLEDKTAVLATAKHFAGYSETQGGRDASEADLSVRKLRSWFLPPFERAVREGCRTFMLGYQSIDGVPITANKWLLNDVLKGEWGFQGTLVTDWDNVGRMVWEQKTMASFRDASAAAINAGNDLVMTTWQFFDGAQEAVADGLVAESSIDDAVRRILKLKFELGLFEDARAPSRADQKLVIGSKQHTETNLQIARESLVLLENQGVLPISEERSNLRIAVVGPNADDAQNQLGDWAGNSGQVGWMPTGHPREKIKTVLDGIREMAQSGWSVEYSPGAEIAHLVDDPRGDLPDGQPRPQIVMPAAPNEELIAEALRASRDSDVIVAVVGDCIALAGELRSTATLELVGGQLALLEELAKLEKPLVVVVLSTKPLVLPESVTHAEAVIQAFSPGMMGGQAVAELIFGRINATGKLPVTIPRHVGQQPIYYNQVRGQHGDRYADLTQEPAYHFGYGLSYTSVEYSNIRLQSQVVSKSGVIVASVDIKNSGRHALTEIAQAYVTDQVASLTWAEKELKAFVRVDLAPGEAKTISIEIEAADCSIVDSEGRRHVEPGRFTLSVGPSSRTPDLLTEEFELLDA